MFKHILVPVDGSNSSMLAVHKGVELAKAFGSTLTAVYVVDPYPFTGVGADFAYGQSASRRRGESYSTEIIIDIAGRAKDGTETSSHIEIVHPRGQAPLTALGVVLGLEALLGLRANAPAAGLYLPELLIDPSYFVGEMMAIGARFDVAR